LTLGLYDAISEKKLRQMRERERELHQDLARQQYELKLQQAEILHKKEMDVAIKGISLR
jgi:hypothetical protein